MAAYVAESIIIVSWSFTSTSILSIIVRLTANLISSRKYRLDDYLIVVAAFILVFYTTALTLVLNKAGHYAGAFSPSSLDHGFTAQGPNEKLQVRLNLIGGLGWMLALWILKGCVFLWLRRLIKPSDTPERALVRAIAGILIITLMTSIALTLQACGPLQSLTVIQLDPTKICTNTIIPPSVIGGADIINNLLLLTMVLLLMIKTYVPRKQTIVRCLILGLSLLTIACSSVRTALSVQGVSLFAVIFLANGEVLLFCVLANAPYLHGSVWKRTEDTFQLKFHTRNDFEQGQEQREPQVGESIVLSTPIKVAHAEQPWSPKSPHTVFSVPVPLATRPKQRTRGSYLSPEEVSGFMSPPSPAVTINAYSPHSPATPVPETPTLSPDISLVNTPAPPAEPKRGRKTPRNSRAYPPGSPEPTPYPLRRSSIASRISYHMRKSPAIKILRTTEVRITSEVCEEPHAPGLREDEWTASLIGPRDLGIRKAKGWWDRGR